MGAVRKELVRRVLDRALKVINKVTEDTAVAIDELGVVDLREQLDMLDHIYKDLNDYDRIKSEEEGR